MDVCCTLDYTLRLWAPTSASRAISAVAELLVFYTDDHCAIAQLLGQDGDSDYSSD